MEIQVEEVFCAAHRLNTSEAGDCSQLHGHTYRVIVKVSGSLYGETGWVLNFHDLRALVREVLPDHCTILHAGDPVATELEKLNFRVVKISKPPTAEALALHLGDKIEARLAGTGRGHLESITIYESPTSAATWSPKR